MADDCVPFLATVAPGALFTSVSAETRASGVAAEPAVALSTVSTGASAAGSTGMTVASTAGSTSISATGATGVSACKPAAIEFSVALDAQMTEFVESAMRGDDYAARLAPYGRFSPTVLVAGAVVALAECRAAALAALCAHGLGANEVLQALTLVNLTTAFMKASAAKIIAVLKTTIEIIPHAQNNVECAACTCAFSRGLLSVLEHVHALRGRCPNKCLDNTMIKLVSQTDEDTFCSVFVFWQKTYLQHAARIVATEVSQCAQLGYLRATRLLLESSRIITGDAKFSQASIAAFYALKKKQFGVLAYVVANYALDRVDSSVDKKIADMKEWVELLENLSPTEQSQYEDALKTAFATFPKGTLLPLIIQSIYACSERDLFALKLVCFQPIVDWLRQTNQFASLVEQKIEAICARLPQAPLKEFFAAYGDLVGFTSRAKIAPSDQVVRALIATGSRDAPALFAELSREHACTVTMETENLWKSQCFVNVVALPAEVRASHIVDNFEAFYDHAVCLTTPALASFTVATILLQEFPRQETAEALMRISRISAMKTWHLRIILIRLLNSRKIDVVKRFFDFCRIVPSDILPANYDSGDGYTAYTNDGVVMPAVYQKKVEFFEVLVRAIKPSRKWASYLLMNALVEENLEIAAICREFGGELLKNEEFDAFVQARWPSYSEYSYLDREIYVSNTGYTKRGAELRLSAIYQRVKALPANSEVLAGASEAKQSASRTTKPSSCAMM